MWLFADHVDHPARVLNPIEQRGWPLEHLDPIRRDVERTALHDRHAVAHDRAVAVVAKATFHHRVLSAAQGIALGDATDVIQCVIQIARRLIANDLSGDHVDGLRDLHRIALAAHHRRDRRRLIAEVIVRQRRDAGRPEVQGTEGGLGFKGKRVGIGAPSVKTRLPKQLLQGLFGTQATFERRGLQTKGCLVGVDHTQAGQAAEVIQRLRQSLGGLIEFK